LSGSAHASPIHVTGDRARQLRPVTDFNEAFIQDLIYRFPESIPVREIDDAFAPLVPVCTELRTPAGLLDVLYVTPGGRLAIAETKLWRNPDARRRVVAQILDYAKELARWDYGDLQREINRKLVSTGNTLYRIALGEGAATESEEAAFVDAVGRNLQRGRFLLLVVGDGIREGAAGLADFLSAAGHLEFVFAMVELSVFEVGESSRLVVPRILSRTIELPRVVVELPEGLTIRHSAGGGSVESEGSYGQDGKWEREKSFYREFWREFVESLDLDDPGQPLPQPANAQNLYLYLPTRQAWVSAYFAKSHKRVGVYFRRGNTQLGQKIGEVLSAEREDILRELGEETSIRWSLDEPGGSAGVLVPCDDVLSDDNREAVASFFREWINRFINVFRPRVKRIEADL